MSAPAAALLRDRLASLGGARPEPRPRPRATPPRGFEPVDTPYGTAWRRDEVLAEGRLDGVRPPVAHAYFDTETTGLGGGAGTYAFAAAVARPVPAGVEVVQVLLASPAEEAAFLHVIGEALRSAPACASYNGSTFDLPLLRSRWVMARMPGELQHPEHVDLLHLARSLLRQRLESCTLRSVETALLGFEREDDIPGALIPAAYFGWLRGGPAHLLEAALEHNRQDVVSLHYVHARLLLRLEGRDPWMEAADWLALGRHLTRRRRRADGWRALRNAAELGQGEASAAAALVLARRLVRLGRHARAAALLESVHCRLPASAGLAIARARLLEWRLRDPAAAYEVVSRALLEAPDGPARRDLEHRAERLRRRRRS